MLQLKLELKGRSTDNCHYGSTTLTITDGNVGMLKERKDIGYHSGKEMERKYQWTHIQGMMQVQASSSPSSTRLAASSRRRRTRAAFMSGSGEVVMACRSMQTLPKLEKSRSSICVSSELMPPFPVGVAEPGCGLEAARTVETRDETREVGVADPAPDERPVTSRARDGVCGGLLIGASPSRGPRGVSERSVSRTGLGWRRSSVDVRIDFS